MEENNKIQLFEGKQVRYVWDAEKEKYFFSVVDVIQVLTDTDRPRKYWSDLKNKLIAEGSELSAKIGQLKLPSSDGKKYLTDVADTEQVFRLIQSVPSKKAEPFKLWLAAVGRQRIDQLQDPEQSIEQAIKDYRRLGYSEEWINQRIKFVASVSPKEGRETEALKDLLYQLEKMQRYGFRQSELDRVKTNYLNGMERNVHPRV